ncbi:hypothetical protein GA0061081_103225 [Gilliamella bombicola]|uniref:Uncharacterized protein n=1 Tax=Gilliamella bombicola TaxID=1798182 RepID=A0A1C4B0R9_9GAMM|nr:hypothetical protein GA0061081_103225 [Gilliamella bombicola]
MTSKFTPIIYQSIIMVNNVSNKIDIVTGNTIFILNLSVIQKCKLDHTFMKEIIKYEH